MSVDDDEDEDEEDDNDCCCFVNVVVSLQLLTVCGKGPVYLRTRFKV